MLSRIYGHHHHRRRRHRHHRHISAIFFLLIGEEIFTFKVNQDIHNLNVTFGSNLYISGKYFWQYHSILDV